MIMLKKLNKFLENAPPQEIQKALDKVSKFNNVGPDIQDLFVSWEIKNSNKEKKKPRG